MKSEQQLVGFVCGTSFRDLPAWVVGITKDQLLADYAGQVLLVVNVARITFMVVWAVREPPAWSSAASWTMAMT